MHNLARLTEDYVKAFNDKDLALVADLMADDFTLTDPSVTSLGPKDKALAFIANLFKSHPSLSFESHKIICDTPYTALHFSLTLGDVIYDGVDLITWREGRMICMEAYLTPRT